MKYILNGANLEQLVFHELLRAISVNDQNYIVSKQLNLKSVSDSSYMTAVFKYLRKVFAETHVPKLSEVNTFLEKSKTATDLSCIYASKEREPYEMERPSFKKYLLGENLFTIYTGQVYVTLELIENQAFVGFKIDSTSYEGVASYYFAKVVSGPALVLERVSLYRLSGGDMRPPFKTGIDSISSPSFETDGYLYCYIK